MLVSGWHITTRLIKDMYYLIRNNMDRYIIHQILDCTRFYLVFGLYAEASQATTTIIILIIIISSSSRSSSCGINVIVIIATRRFDVRHQRVHQRH